MPAMAMRRVGAILLVSVACLQLAVVAGAFSGVLDPGYGTLEWLGALYGVGLAVAIAAAAWTTASAPGWRAATRLAIHVLALVAVLAAAAAWASLVGQPLLLEPSENVRIGALIVADLLFAGWLIVVWRTGGHGRPPALPWLALFASLRGIVEILLFLPVLTAAIVPVGQAGGFSGGGMLYAFALAGLVLAGFVIAPLWELALARWLIGVQERN